MLLSRQVAATSLYLSHENATTLSFLLIPFPVFTQWMDKYFGQKYAKSFAYQILLALSTNIMGYGFAGLTRRFLVYPSFCLYPRSLVTIALNKALHNGESGPDQGQRMSLQWSECACLLYPS